MKYLNQCKTGFLYLLFSTLILVPALSKASDDGDFKVEKKKDYSKSYTVSGDTKIKLDNSFGEMKINTWTNNEVKVEVHITAKANTDQKAQEILDNIKIEDGKEGNTVYFKTNVNGKNKNHNNNDNDDGDDDDNDNKGKHKNYNNTGMQINMTVYMPAGNPINAINSFGPMTVPDLTGEAQISSKFGNLTCGKLTNNKELSVEFGKGDIKYVNGGDVNIKFSSADIGKMSGEIKANFEFSKGGSINLDNSLKSLDLKNSYSTIELELSKDFSGDFDIKTSFGDFRNYSSARITEEKNDDDDRGPKFDHRYSGKSGNGTTKVKIKSSFGTIKVS